MRTVDSTKPWQDQLRPLSAEVEAVRRASGESFFEMVLDFFFIENCLKFESITQYSDS